MARTDKLLAEWFWTDRWMGSSGFLLPMLARGLYREMLTQAWRRGAKLPNDFAAIKRAIGATDDEWAEAWPLVSKFWRIDIDNNLINDTQLEIYGQAVSIQKVRAEVGRLGGLTTQAKRQANTQANQEANAQANFNPPSPSPSPSLISVSESESVSEKEKKKSGNSTNGNGHEPNARSKRPIYQSDRFVVFEWQLDNLSRVLGPNTEAFDLHAFFDDLSKRSRNNGQIVPANGRNGDFWEWLQAQVHSEAKRRGLPYATIAFESKFTKQLRQATEESLKRHAAIGSRRLSSDI